LNDSQGDPEASGDAVSASEQDGQDASERAGPGAGQQRIPLRTVAREWTRIGVTGFGGPPAHIRLLRRLVVERRRWLEPVEFEDAVAACNLLPGPASTQLAIFCAQSVAGPLGAVVGGLGFVVPAVVAVLVLSTLFLAHAPPDWVRGAGSGAGAAVAVVAVDAGLRLTPSSWRRVYGGARHLRWLAYLALGAASAAVLGLFLVLVLLGCGLVELGFRVAPGHRLGSHASWMTGSLVAAVAGVGGIGALAWVAFKVGALSYGGGFVIVPLMQHDATHTYHWMTANQFLNGVALGQVTPGPVVSTVAAVGYAAHGVGGGVLAAAIAFAPSFALVMAGGRRFERLRTDKRAQAFLDGAGPAAIGAILGAAIPLADALHETWQWLILAGAAIVLLLLRRSVVATLLAAGVVGAIIGAAGGPLP
jgi:chromate transporter